MWTLVLCLFVVFTRSVAELSEPACELFDSTSLENGAKYGNGTIVLDGVVYPERYQFLYIPFWSPYPEDLDDLKLPVLKGDASINTTIAYIPDYPHTRGCTCQLKICVRKCCRPGSSLINLKCVENTNPPDFKPDLWSHGRDVLRKRPWNSEKYKYVIGNTCINGTKYSLEPSSSSFDEHYLFKNGFLYMPNFEGDLKYFDHKSYCMDLTQKPASSEWIYETFMCYHTNPQNTSDIVFQIFPIGLIISIVFLILTFLVYLVLPELHTIHGKALMHYVGALAVAYSFLATIQTSTRHFSNAECLAYAVICYMTFILSFFWLNIMSFDIWWTFSGKGGFRKDIRENERKKFLLYCCYSWLGTLVIFSITMGMQFHPSIPEEQSPGFGLTKCWLQQSAMFAYFYLPMLILIVVNIFFFGATAYKIYSIKRETKMLRTGENNRRKNSKLAHDTQRFWLYVKLFLVMGVNWSMEILSWAIGGPKGFWIVTDIFNCLQGLLIFLIFVFKPTIKNQLIRRYYTLRDKPIPPRTASCCPATQTTSFSNENNNFSNPKNEIELQQDLLK